MQFKARAAGVHSSPCIEPKTTGASRRYTCFILAVVQAMIVICLYSFFQDTFRYTTRQAPSLTPHVVAEKQSENLKPHIVVGILTSEDKRELRDSQRNTWLHNAIHADIPFKLTYTFLIDRPTNKTIAENNAYNDILFLNVTHSGRAVRFGEKMHRWWKYVHEHYPDVSLAARVDDDVFVCVPQLFQRLYELKSSKLYYGWAHGQGNKIDTTRRVDEMFVVLGKDIIDRIAKRRYCENKNMCNVSSDLVDLDYGGTSMGQWLSIYNDIDFRPDNEHIIQFGREAKYNVSDYVRQDFCEKRLIFHKATPQIMTQLNKYNTIAKGHTDHNGQFTVYETTECEGTVTGCLYSGTDKRHLPSRDQYSFPPVHVEKDKMVACDNWAVVTTIFKVSEAVNHIAKASDWCLVIVADLQTPEKDVYMDGLNGNRIKYLSTTEQSELYPSLAKTIPYKHFGRKNIGYIYAIQHNASAIWDFDDDNIGAVDINMLRSTESKFVSTCKDFRSVVVNPYPYFGVKDNQTWPRGFPLQQIKDNNTIPKICKYQNEPNIGVVQSLANVQPDVDAIFRLTRDVPFNFSATKETHPAFVLPRNVYAPFNAQATLWTRQTFLYMALPLTVNGRVSDIWRSYIALHFMHRDSIQLAFSFPYVTQHRNEHMDIKDFNAELHLYERSKQLVDFLSSEDAAKAKTILNMYELMYKRGYIELNDLKFIDVWIKTFNVVSNNG